MAFAEPGLPSAEIVVFRSRDPQLAEMEKRRGQNGIGATGRSASAKCERAPAPPDAISGTSTARADRLEQLDIVAFSGAVTVHARDKQFAGAELCRSLCPLDCIEVGLAATTMRVDRPLCRLDPACASIATTMNCRPNDLLRA